MASGGLELALVSRGTAVLAEWSAVGGTCAQLPAARRRHGGATGACSVDSGYMLHFENECGWCAHRVGHSCAHALLLSRWALISTEHTRPARSPPDGCVRI